MPIPSDDVLLNKAAIIERCIRRIKEEYALVPELDNPTHVDALTLNIERACQAAIDMAMHMVATQHLGVPQSSAEAFSLIHKAAIHEYQELDHEILHYIAREGIQDYVRFCTALGLNIQS